MIISRRNEFLNWLSPEKKAEMLKYESMYYFRLRKFWKVVPKYAKNYSIYLKGRA